MAFVRERQIYTSVRKGEEMKEVEIFIVTDGQRQYYNSHRPRKRVALTSPKQANLNDKRSRIYFDRLANTNFGVGDLHVSLTYSNAYLPSSIEEGETNVRRLIPRIKKLYEKKKGIKFYYIWLTSYYTGNEGLPVRMHHHMLLPKGVERDLIEDMWCAKNKPGVVGEKMGAVNCDRIQADGNGISALCAYLARQPREGRMRRWHASIGLKKPMITEPDDDKYDFHDLKKMVEDNADCPNVGWWERKYPGWTLQADRRYAYTVSNSEISGTSLRIKLRKLTEKELTANYESRKQRKKQMLIKKLIKIVEKRMKRMSKNIKNRGDENYEKCTLNMR